MMPLLVLVAVLVLFAVIASAVAGLYVAL